MSKRIFDLLFSLISVIFLLPLIIVLGVSIILIDRQNPFFVQYRAGINSKKFKILKFKTMKFDNFEKKNVVTRLGRIIRFSKLDEILQLINVLSNDMSLIGPRPLYLEFSKFYKKKHLDRMSIKPGITGLAQIKLRDSTNWDRKFNFDVIYVKKRSWSLDIYILFMTIGFVLKSIFFRDKRPIEDINYKDNFFLNYKND